MTNFRIGTRGSELALWQAHEVARRLAAEGHASKHIQVRTTGDQHQNAPLSSIGGKGLFIKEPETSPARRVIDIAAPSLKHVPSTNPPRLLPAPCPAPAPPEPVCAPPASCEPSSSSWTAALPAVSSSGRWCVPAPASRMA